MQKNQGNFVAVFTLPQAIQPDLDWWIYNIKGMYKHIRSSDLDTIIYTDASKAGWGCHIPKQNLSIGLLP